MPCRAPVQRAAPALCCVLLLCPRRGFGKSDEEINAGVDSLLDVDFEQFKGLMQGHTTLGHIVLEQTMRKKFEEIDDDCSGFLDRDELVNAMRVFGKTDDEIDEAVNSSSCLSHEQTSCAGRCNGCFTGRHTVALMPTDGCADD